MARVNDAVTDEDLSQPTMNTSHICSPVSTNWHMDRKGLFTKDNKDNSKRKYVKL